jgi:membrane protein involved in colicin uptake
VSTQSQHTRDLAWLSAFPEDKRFRRITFYVLALCFVFSISIPLIQVPPIQKNTNQPVPQRFAKLILEKKLEKKELVKKELTEAEKEALRKAEEERRKKLEEERKKREEELKKKREEDKKKAEEQRKRLDEQHKKDLEEQRKHAEEQKKLDAERQKQEAERQRQEAERRRQEEERRRAEAEKQRVAAEKKKGEELAASLFGDLSDLSTESTPAATSSAKLVSANKQPAAQQTIASPNLLASKTATAGKGTGGIDTSKLSQVDTSGAGIDLETRKTTVVEDVDLGVLDAANASDSTVNASGQPIRSARELNGKLEASKGRFNKIYQRALRNDPTLGGKVVLKITILPDGKVENVEIVSSDINDQGFIEKLITAVKGINFGSKENIGKVIATYPIDFGML